MEEGERSRKKEGRGRRSFEKGGTLRKEEC